MVLIMALLHLAESIKPAYNVVHAPPRNKYDKKKNARISHPSLFLSQYLTNDDYAALITIFKHFYE